MAATRKPLVIVTRKLPDAVETKMRARFDARINPDDMPFGNSALADAAKTAEVLVPTITDKLDATLLDAAGPGLKLIANFGAGLDHVDIAAAAARGIVVTNTPGVLTADTADLAFALILAVPRRLAEGMKAIERGAFAGWHPTWMMGRSLTGMRLGIIGMGRIGRAVARRARAFGMAIHYHNRNPVAETIARELEATYWRDLDAMLGEMDIVSVNCPSSPATRHLLSAERLKRMKPGAFLVNTARGDIVDEHALALALERGELAGAGLDVFENEPRIDPKLPMLPNVVLLPHMGSGTVEARTAMGEKVIANIDAFAAGRAPPDLVRPMPR